MILVFFYLFGPNGIQSMQFKVGLYHKENSTGRGTNYTVACSYDDHPKFYKTEMNNNF